MEPVLIQVTNAFSHHLWLGLTLVVVLWVCDARMGLVTLIARLRLLTVTNLEMCDVLMAAVLRVMKCVLTKHIAL